MGRHARPLGGTHAEPAPEPVPQLGGQPGTGRRRAAQRPVDAPSTAAGAGRHRALNVPADPSAPGSGRRRKPVVEATLEAVVATSVEAVGIAVETVVETAVATPVQPAAAPIADAAPRRHRAPKRRVPLAVPAVAGTAAVAVATAGGVAITSGGTPGLESVAGAGTGSDVQRVVLADRATRGEVRPAMDLKQADQARARAKALRDARLAAAAAARLAAIHQACGYNVYAQRDEAFTSEMLRNARIIVDVSQRMNLPPRAAVIAIATALQESYLKNMTGGHLDSAGLFQQRPSAGWGSYRQVTDPYYAARKFYSVLLQVDGWRRMPLTQAAQDVQVSAFPWAYARWEAMAAKVVSQVLKVPVDSLNCSAR
jgi:hypothetical protein